MVDAYAEAANIIAGALSTQIQGWITIAPTKLDKVRKERISELREKRDAGTLGLTQAQLEELQLLGSLNTQAGEKEFFSRQADVLRTTEATPEALRLAQVAGQEALRKERSELDRQVMRAERESELIQLAELETLQAQEQARKDQIKQAWADKLSLGLMSGSQGISAAQQNNMEFGKGNVTAGTYAPTGSPTNTSQFSGQSPPPSTQPLTPEEEEVYRLLSKLSPESRARAMGRTFGGN